MSEGESTRHPRNQGGAMLPTGMLLIVGGLILLFLRAVTGEWTALGTAATVGLIVLGVAMAGPHVLRLLRERRSEGDH